MDDLTFQDFWLILELASWSGKKISFGRNHAFHQGLVLIISDCAQKIGIRKSYLILDDLVLSEPLVAPPDAGDQSRPTGGLGVREFFKRYPRTWK